MDNSNNNQNQYLMEYELDIRGLFRLFFKKKFLIFAFSIIFAFIAFIISCFMKYKWTATAVTDLPTINNLGYYYFNKQLIHNLDLCVNKTVQEDFVTITKEVYQEFIKQLTSYDTRRQFWLTTNYYKNRLTNNSKIDIAFLDELINNIEFLSSDDFKSNVNTIKLIAETSDDSNLLLRKYVDFANARTINNLNNEIKNILKTKMQLFNFFKKPKDINIKDIYEERLNLLKEKFNYVLKKDFIKNKNYFFINDFFYYKMFMFDIPLLQIGNSYICNDNNMLLDINKNLVIKNDFQSYRYLKTPENPINCDSPRKEFITILWGIIGFLVGVIFVFLKGRNLNDKMIKK
ncbi:Wzz/FepE/Etk N-terminal domain-containing protein [Candidatus Providencia siddallii]|uniref:ECA polysaccharide chain length modulation protein n=1 Tax=Candidatus Providencia siddallii TaxID=1715285 RepID=A0ABP1CE60_9GAMM